MPKHRCQSKDNCYKLIDIKNRYCDKHKGERFKSYDANRKDDEHYKFIRSSRWKRIRLIKLQLNPKCEVCCVEAQMVDHCKERKDGGCTDCIDNLVSLCNHHHQIKTNEVRQARAKGLLDEYYKNNCKNNSESIVLAG